MKKIFLALTLIVGTVFLTGCKGDSLETPAYKSSSALYQVTMVGAPLTSVEFTESGNYVIVKSGLPQNAPLPNGVSRAEEEVNKPACFLFSLGNQPETRSSSGNKIITGKYTKKDDTTYELKGFGTIKVTATDGSNYSLIITETGSDPYTLTAAKKEQYKDSEPTGKLCRTWKIAGIRIELEFAGSFEGKSVELDIDEEVDNGDMAELFLKVYESSLRQLGKTIGKSASDSEIKKAVDDMRDDVKKTYPNVENMIFTQAGTYMVTYKGDKLAISTWSWTDSDCKKIRYSWDYSNMGSNNGKSGECSIEFDGSRCYVVESNAEAFDRFLETRHTNKAKVTYTLEEE